ncbi:MAG: glutamate--tRNA ligase [Patescibacteria group bacterium]
MIRTRFAPSPTGELHIGGARTALFSYLFAKHHGGEFLLRIEDTDRERLVEGATIRIIESLEWLGLFPDNYHSIVIQSDRQEIYKKYALELVSKGAAYLCTCSKERLEELRREQEAKKLPPQYDRHCRNVKCQNHTPPTPPLSKGGVERGLEELLKEGAVVRLKMPETGSIVVVDLIRGNVEFRADLQDDPVLLKSDGWPTYHLAAVVDDHEMEISHVIRAEEWLSSTPKHLTLYQAFGWAVPQFAHLPMILGPDRSKLSKRHGATAVLDYKNRGYLPHAIINFIALLGWSPKDEREEFSLAQLIRDFRLEQVNRAPAVFNIDKLNSINARYIQKRDPGKLKQELAEFGPREPLAGEITLAQRGGYATLAEIKEAIEGLRQKPVYKAALLVFKKSDKPKTLKGLRLARQKLAGANIWSAEELQNVLVEVVNDHNLSSGDVFWPVRVALSGREKSPSPAELLVALDRVESLRRIDAALEKLQG